MNKCLFGLVAEMIHTAQAVTFGTSPIPLSSKNIARLVKVPVHFNVY